MVDFENTTLNDPTDRIIEQFKKEITPIYPKAGETLIDFLAEKKKNNQEVMLCPRCSAIFDKSAAKAFEESEKRKFQNRRAQNSSGPKETFEGVICQGQTLQTINGLMVSNTKGRTNISDGNQMFTTKTSRIQTRFGMEVMGNLTSMGSLVDIPL
ncbi:hypothetical protein SESBI_36510 [Sesbania bispinosa]|nr:hypothetical protein SESBI_36510 [Sesbania bispinosa]